MKPLMTRQHFEIIAEILSKYKNEQTSIQIAEHFSIYLKETNENFNPQRFINKVKTLITENKQL